MNLRSALFLFMLTACGQVPGQQRELPILDFPADAPTRREFAQQVDQFFQSETRLYQEFSQDPHAVQALAIPFLESSIERFSELASNEAKHSNLWPELPDMGEKIVAAGSEDPIVLMHLADALRHDLQFDAARKTAEKAVNRFKDSKYPQGLHFLAIYRLYLTQFEGVWPGFRSLPGTRKKLYEASPAWLAYANELPNGTRIGLSIYFSAVHLDERLRFELEPVEAALKVYQNMEAPDPWILEMLQARYYFDLSWRYRGGGFANEVEREGWQAFEKFMKLASAHARNAYTLNPQYPESSALLINIALAGHDDETVFYWFERCVAAEIDHADAYLTLLTALRPRWGGSYDAMLEFGEQCADTKRFDTDVPLYLLESCYKVVEDSGTITWLEIFERTRLYELTKRTVNKLVEHPIRQLTRAINDDGRNDNPQNELSEAQIALLTQLLGMAEHSQHFEDASLLWERLGKSASEHYLESFSLNPTYSKWHAHACIEFGDVMDKEIRSVLDTAHINLESAKRAHDKVTGWLAESENPHAQNYLRTWLQLTEMSIQYHDGKWVDLKFSTGLPEWFLQKGRWTVEDESTVMANNLTNLNTTQIYHRMRFPGDREIQFELEKGNHTSALLGGLAVGNYAGLKGGRLLFANLKRNELGFNTPRTDPNSSKVKTMNPIQLRTWKGGQYEVSAGATRFIALTEDSGFDDADGLVGLSSVYRVRIGGEIRFKNIRIRKLRYGPRPDFGNDPDRIEYFTSLIESSPDEIENYGHRGLSHFRLGQLAVAIPDLEKSIELKTRPLLRIALGQSRCQTGEYEFGIKLLAETVKELRFGISDRKFDRFTALHALSLGESYLSQQLSTNPIQRIRNGNLALELAQEAEKNNRLLLLLSDGDGGLKDDDTLYRQDAKRHTAVESVFAAACAQAELKQFNAAIKSLAEVKNHNPTDAETKRAVALRTLFRQKEPFRNPSETELDGSEAPER